MLEKIYGFKAPCKEEIFYFYSSRKLRAESFRDRNLINFSPFSFFAELFSSFQTLHAGAKD